MMHAMEPEKPIPVVRDGKGKLIRDYSLQDWGSALDEERTEVLDAAVEYRRHPSWNNRQHLMEELADLKTVCTSWQNALGADEEERGAVQRAVNRKNRKRGYLDTGNRREKDDGEGFD